MAGPKWPAASSLLSIERSGVVRISQGLERVPNREGNLKEKSPGKRWNTWKI